MSIANEPAYPMSVPGQFNASGLTKRELFAAMAMEGMLASGECTADNASALPVLLTAVSKCAVDISDALIAALEAK